MDLLDRLLEHDAWTTRQLLLRCQGLTEEQLDRDCDMSHRSVRATLLHLIRNMEVWSDLMAAKTMRENPGLLPGGRSVSGLIDRLDRAASELATVAHAVAQRNGWDEEWLDTLDEPPTRKTFGGSIAHVITHSMHHRAQLIHMLRRIGVEDLPEGDVLSWENRCESPDPKAKRL